MSWLFLAILAQVFYTAVIFIDKYILEREIADYRGMPIYSAAIGAVFGILIWVLTGFPILSFRDGLLIILTGVLTTFGAATYFAALSDDEASKVTILFQMQPVITLILSFLILGERISSQQLIGFFLILISTTLISLEKKLEKVRFSKVFWLILLTDFLWALAYVVFKFAIDTNSFSKVLSYESWGIGLGGLILYVFFPSIRNAFNKTNKRVRTRVLWFISINEGVFLFSRLLKYLAISKGPVSLVDVVGGIQIIFAIIFGFILTSIAPKIFKENISSTGLSKKIVMAGLVLVGLWLVQR